MEKTDEAIATDVQAGNTEAFGELVGRYEAKISRYARRFLFGYDDVRDQVQDVFIRAYTHINSFNAKKLFSPWIYRIAHNQFINAIKKKGREPLPIFDPDTIFPHPSYEPQEYDRFDAEKWKTVIDTHLASLDPKYREVLVLYYYEEIGYREIAEILHIPSSTVGVRLKRGKEALEKLLVEASTVPTATSNVIQGSEEILPESGEKK